MIKMDRKGIKSNHTEDQKNQEVDGHNIILKLGVNEPCEDNHVKLIKLIEIII